MNKKNCRHWASEKPDYHLEKSLHNDKVTVWAAMCKDGIIGPLFFEDHDGQTETINNECHMKVPKKKFIPALRQKVYDLDRIWFQEDGPTPHTSGVVLEWLKKTLVDRVISLKTQYPWPPHSPDLSQLDF